MEKLTDLKRGDTAVWRLDFVEPYEGFGWAGVTVDVALTNIKEPADNEGAAATRMAQTVTTSDTGAYYVMTLTEEESKALKPNTTYILEAQLRKDNLVFTPFTAEVKVLQDYVI